MKQFLQKIFAETKILIKICKAEARGDSGKPESSLRWHEEQESNQNQCVTQDQMDNYMDCYKHILQKQIVYYISQGYSEWKSCVLGAQDNFF